MKKQRMDRTRHVVACSCCELQSLPLFVKAAKRIAAIQLQCAPCSSTEEDDKKTLAVRTVEELAGDLRELNLALWNNPEPAYEEHQAHDNLCSFLEKHGHNVTRQYLGLETAFRCEVGQGTPVIAICAEYDALPEIGHACGHNLISTAAVAAFLSAARVIKEGGTGSGTVVLFGTPAEEMGGGKVDMLDAGAFDTVDVAMMVHPAPVDVLYPKMLAWQWVRVRYHGKNAHASMNPHEGVNALDAQISLFGSIGLLRQQLDSTLHVHGIILNGGDRPNIIPHLTESEWIVRAMTSVELERLKAKVEACFKAAGMATGCEVEVEWLGNPYGSVSTNGPMAEAYRANATACRAGTYATREAEEKLPPGGSTDMGNVSWVVPTIHPVRGFEWEMCLNYWELIV
jgi:amidohydrolase